jgi:hypothetical protein
LSIFAESATLQATARALRLVMQFMRETVAIFAQSRPDGEKLPEFNIIEITVNFVAE